MFGATPAEAVLLLPPIGVAVTAVNLTSSPELNGRSGYVAGHVGERALVDFGAAVGKKSLRSCNLSISTEKDLEHSNLTISGQLDVVPAIGTEVRAYALNASTDLNGCWGTVVELQGDRAVVDFGVEHGRKSIRPQNLQKRPQPGRVKLIHMENRRDLDGCCGIELGMEGDRILVELDEHAIGRKSLKAYNVLRCVGIGIDLGTSRTCVAAFRSCDAEPHVIKNRHGQLLTPSCVAFTPTGMLVGELALAQATQNPQGTFTTAKRELGHALEEPALEVLAAILRTVWEDAEAALGERVKDVVLTIPACSTASQRAAATQAVESVGLNLIRLVPEPTAAALAYSFYDSDSVTMVVDFGGGTFDASIVDSSGATVEVLACCGDPGVGGEDVDTAIVQHCVKEFHRQFNVDLKQDLRALRQLRMACEDAKKHLTMRENTIIHVEHLGRDTIPGGYNFQYTLSRSRVAELSAGSMEKCSTCISNAKRDAGKEFSSIVLVGGASQLACFQDMLLTQHPHIPLQGGRDPKHVVALGAACQVGIMKGVESRNLRHLLLLDILGHDVFLELQDGTAFLMVDSATTLPLRYSAMLATSTDNQREARIQVFSRPACSSAINYLGTLQISGLLPRPAGLRVPICIDIDNDGLESIFLGIERKIPSDEAQVLESSWVRASRNERLQIPAISSPEVQLKGQNTQNISPPEILRPRNLNSSVDFPRSNLGSSLLASSAEPPILRATDKLSEETQEEALSVLRAAASQVGVYDTNVLVFACHGTACVEGLSPPESIFTYAYTWDYVLAPDPPGCAAEGLNFFEKLNLGLHMDSLPKPATIAVCYIVRALAKLPSLTSGTRVFRGISDPLVADMYEGGCIVYWKTFVSTSTDLLVALNFAGSAGVIFDVALHDPEGTSHGVLGEVSAFGDQEGEVLLRANLKFVVVEKIHNSFDHGERTAIRLVQVRDDSLVVY